MSILLELEAARDRTKEKIQGTKDHRWLGGVGPEREYSLAHDKLVQLGNQIPGHPLRIRLKYKYRSRSQGKKTRGTK